MQCKILITALLVSACLVPRVSPQAAQPVIDPNALLREGKELLGEQQELGTMSTKLEAEHNDIAVKILALRPEVVADEKRVSDWNAECGRTFTVPDEQAAYDRCQQWREKVEPLHKEFLLTKKQPLLTRLDNLKTREEVLTSKSAELRDKLAVWKSRMVRAKLAGYLPNCGRLTGTEEEVVNSFQNCWDHASLNGSARGLKPAGTAFFDQQKSSLAPGANFKKPKSNLGPGPKIHLDDTYVPPPPKTGPLAPDGPGVARRAPLSSQEG